jgi:glucokinase
MRVRWRNIDSAPAVGAEHMVFLTLGTGLGAGIIAAGSLYLGANGDAGEIGHVRLSPTGRLVPQGWLDRRLGQRRGHCATRRAHVGASGTARPLQCVARAGGRRVDGARCRPCGGGGGCGRAGILRSSGERLGQALAMLIDVLNPQRIVLGGLAWRMGETLACPYAQVINARPCRKRCAPVRLFPQPWESRSAMWPRSVSPWGSKGKAHRIESKVVAHRLESNAADQG